MRKINTMLFRMILKSKAQFFAVLVVIIIGICTFVSLNMTGINLGQTVETYYKDNEFPDLFLGATRVPYKKVEELTLIEGVDKAMGRISLDVPVVTETMDERVTIRLITTKGKQDELSKPTFIEGGPLSHRGKEILLLQQFAEARNITIGDEIKVQVEGLQQSLEVVGIVANPEYVYLIENVQSMLPSEGSFGVGYISESFGQQISGLLGSYNEVLVQYAGNVDEEALIDKIQEKLDSFGLKQVVKQDEQLSYALVSEEVKGINTMAESLPLLFLFVAGLILMMMLSRMVKKDRIKIGVLKAMGYSRLQILSHYVKYALVAGVIGGLLGSVMGMFLAGALTKMLLQFFNIPLLKLEFYYSYILLGIFLSCIFCAISGIIGARGILKITPAEAMKKEAPKAGKRIFLEKLPFFWKRLSFSNKLVSKNIFRNKKRTIFVLAGVMLTYGMMLFTASMPDVVDQMMIKHFDEFQTMDYDISFKNPVSKNAIQDMKHLIEVDDIEGKLEYPFELTNGNIKKGVSIIGIVTDTSFYSFKDPKGEKLSLTGKGILLSENLASSLKVDVGERILVKNPIPGKDDVYLTVEGIVKQAMGINAYMEINSMGELLLEKNMITGVLVNSSDPEIHQKLLEAPNIASVMSTEDMMSVYEEYTEMIMMSMGFMVVLSGVLGFAIVYNATIVSINEREMELSSLRVLGFSKWQIFKMILKENNIIMAVGILLGIPVGDVFLSYASQVYQTDMYTLDMTPTFVAGIGAAIATIIFIIFAQLATYKKIQGLDFLQALKNRES
ncbi:MAG: ABC transporter permease [Anaerovoracaceae bacterium]|jgi:putative ABC transport system permease protein